MPDLQTLLAKFLEQLYAGNVTFTAQALAGDGTAAAPSFSFASAPDLGFYRANAFALGGTGGGVTSSSFTFGAAGGIYQNALGKFGWANTANAATGTVDTAFTRSAAGVVAVGTGAAGSTAGFVDAAGYRTASVAGVATFGPAAVVSITVKGGIVTAIS